MTPGNTLLSPFVFLSSHIHKLVYEHKCKMLLMPTPIFYTVSDLICFLESGEDGKAFCPNLWMDAVSSGLASRSCMRSFLIAFREAPYNVRLPHPGKTTVQTLPWFSHSQIAIFKKRRPIKITIIQPRRGDTLKWKKQDLGHSNTLLSTPPHASIPIWTQRRDMSSSMNRGRLRPR